MKKIKIAPLIFFLSLTLFAGLFWGAVSQTSKVKKSESQKPDDLSTNEAEHNFREEIIQPGDESVTASQAIQDDEPSDNELTYESVKNDGIVAKKDAASLLSNCLPVEVESIDYTVEAYVFTREQGKVLNNGFGFLLRVEARQNDTVKYLKSTVGITGSDLTFELPMETYTEKNGLTQCVYSKDSLWGTWTKSEEPISEAKNKVPWDEITKLGQNCTVLENRENYIVNGNVDYTQMVLLLFDTADAKNNGAFDIKNVLLSSGEDIREAICFNAVIAKETGGLKEISFNLENNNKPELNSVEATIKINEINNVVVMVPEAVKQSAVWEE